MSRLSGNKYAKVVVNLAVIGLIAFACVSIVRGIARLAGGSRWVDNTTEVMSRPFWDVSFLREADGPRDSEAKAFFVDVLSKEPTVEKAYLLIGKWRGESDEVHMLGLVLSGSEDGESVVSRVMKAWKKMGGPIDVMALKGNMERDAAAVARPFYTSQVRKS